jgi:predicted O-methyltransferase YrrM
MYTAPQMAFKYLNYILTASNGKGHGMHSPFVFSFIKNVLNDDRSFYAYQQIEQQRQLFLKDKTIVNIADMGAGSRTIPFKQRSIASIAKSSLKPTKFSQLLFRIINYYQPKNIIELGTSLGITSSYLASAKTDAKVITLEGATEVAAIANKGFQQLNLQNIQLIEGNFDNTLSNAIELLQTIDFAFIDGNHRYEPTVNYFNKILKSSNDKTIIILDDIHWSKEMDNAWNFVKNHNEVTATIDLFFIGIVLLNKDFKTKQHFNIRF